MDTWKVFSEKIPAGSRIRWIPYWSHHDYAEGLLLENKPYASWEVSSRYGDAGEQSMRLRVQAFDNLPAWAKNPNRIEVTDLQFLIDGEWLNFWQVTTR